ncbi:MAG: hypothetical protein ACYC63_08850 [Armatimonadota bacterium]
MNGSWRRVLAAFIVLLLLAGPAGLLQHSHGADCDHHDCVSCLFAATAIAILATAPALTASLLLKSPLGAPSPPPSLPGCCLFVSTRAPPHSC